MAWLQIPGMEHANLLESSLGRGYDSKIFIYFHSHRIYSLAYYFFTVATVAVCGGLCCCWMPLTRQPNTFAKQCLVNISHTNEPAKRKAYSIERNNEYYHIIAYSSWTRIYFGFYAKQCMQYASHMVECAHLRIKLPPLALDLDVCVSVYVSVEPLVL